MLSLMEELFERPGGRPPNYSKERGREGFRYSVEDPSADVLLAIVGDSVVGLATVYLDPPYIRFGRRTWLQDLVVASGHRSGGMGAKLVDAATDWAKERGCTHLELASGAGRVDAHRFYRARGMAEGRVFTRDWAT